MATQATYDLFKLNLLNGTSFIDFDTDTIKVMLVTSVYTPSAATHDFINDASANEVSGINYTAGGATLGTPSVTNSAGTTTVDYADVTWTQNAGGFSTARYAIFYKDTGTPTTSGLISYVDFTTDKGNVSGDLILQLAGTGLFTLAG